jgi:predicted nuclease of restriction endonuclease-like (RecB) superfamily
MRYGKGFTRPALSRMMNFYKLFADKQIVASLGQQLSWTHFRELITIDDPIKRDFYLELTCKEKWSVRTLRDRMDSMLFERTSISKKPAALIRKELDALKSNGPISHDLVFRDPYVLDFLGLQDTYSEQDMESAIIQQLQRFIIELGTDFAFLARQKRITIDNEDFKIDLLFYHRGLRRLVAIDLKLGKFKAAYKGQMELYIRWLDKYERREGEDSPLGLILCSEKKQEQIELLELDKGHIRVAEYMTQLPSKELLAEKLHTAIKVARNNIATTTSLLHSSDKTPA